MNFCHERLNLPLLERVDSPEGRVYKTPQNNKYPSVTTVLSSLSKEGIDTWRKKVGKEEADKISYQAASHGTRVHALAENYLNNLPNWKDGFLPIHLFIFEGIKSILDSRVTKVYALEAPLYSDYFKTAGTVDCVAVFDGKPSIIDFKTSRIEKKKEWISSYFMQEAFYAVAWEERTSIPIKQLVTIISSVESTQVFIEDRDDHIRNFMRVRADYEKTIV